MKNQCPCGSKKPFLVCCQPFISNQMIPITPEELMRSRYCAYAKNNIDYIRQTMAGRALTGFDYTEAKEWSSSVKWLKLEVLASGTLTDSSAFVEFKAYYRFNNRKYFLYEKSEFLFEKGRWYYIGTL